MEHGNIKKFGEEDKTGREARKEQPVGKRKA